MVLFEAVKQVDLTVPLVVRLEGTNVELGKQLLADSGLNLIAADGLSEGSTKSGASGSVMNPSRNLFAIIFYEIGLESSCGHSRPF